MSSRLANGGATVMAYSNDGARDLVSITGPTVSCAGYGQHPFDNGTVGIPERDAVGNISRVDDPSGSPLAHDVQAALRVIDELDILLQRIHADCE